MNVSDFLWILFLFLAVWSMWKQRRISRSRLQFLRNIERRMISLIRRQEAIRLLGIPISRYITVEDSEHILQSHTTYS